MSRKVIALIAAVAGGVVGSLTSQSVFASTVDGTVSAGEYSTVLATQNTPTGFGDNFSELDQALSNYTPGGNLELALTGNLENNGNGLVIFVDSKAGGAISNSVAGGFNQFGSVGGQYTDDWGTDTDGGAAVSPTPGGGSIVSPNFNPDYAIEINAGGGGTSYYVNIVDLTQPNDDTHPNKDIYLGSNTFGQPGVTQTYFRDAGATAAGTITHAFDDSNTAGVTDTDASGAATATTGLELALDSTFLARDPGHALTLLPFITSGDGSYLANQFLPGLGGIDNLGGAGGDGGTPLLDSRFLGDQFYLNAFTPTTSDSGNWSTATWTGTDAPNAPEASAHLVGTSAAAINLDGAGVTLGYLNLDNAAGYTLNGPGSLNMNGGAGAAIIVTTAGNHVVNAMVNIQTDTRVDTAPGTALSFTKGMSIASNHTLDVGGSGVLNLSGTMSNGANAAIAQDTGTVNFNSDIGTGLAMTDRPSVYVSVSTGNAVANLNVSQHLAQLVVNDTGTAVITHSGGSHIVVTNGITTNGTGKLDIADNKVLVKDGTLGTWDPTANGGAGAYTGITGMIQSGRAGGAWNGPGIITSETYAHSPSILTTVAVASADDIGRVGGTLLGEPIESGDVLLMYTYAGDANLDGRINGDDYFAIDSHVNQNGSVFGYENGDFNLDGHINGDDYFLIDSNINNQSLGVFSTSAGVSGVQAVPEPATFSLAALGGLALLRRRRGSR